MDGGFTLRNLADPQRPGRDVARPRLASSFLHRDLSDEALRPPVEPLFGAADLAAQREDGYAAGLAAGRAAGLAEAAASRAAHRTAIEVQSLGAIAAAVADGSRSAATVADRAAEALAKALIASMRAVMPALIARSAFHEVAAMLARVLPGLSREPAVRIEVAPELTGYITDTVAELAPDLRHKITVTATAGMRAGEARVSWESGRALRDPEQVWDSVMEALRPLTGEAEAKENPNGN